MPFHFPLSEFDHRLKQARETMTQNNLDAMLCFMPESQYWLTGYDTFGFCFFQCLIIGQDGTLALLTRAPDLRQAQLTSIIEDITIWKDGEGVNPASDLKALLSDRGFQGKRLGVEFDTVGLTYHNGKRITEALEGFCNLTDASNLITSLRLVKSTRELEHIQTAAHLADAAYDAALDLIAPGAAEGDILAAMQGAVFKGGGDYPGNPFIIGSGPMALLCRYQSGRRTLDAVDQITLEWAGVYAQYHAAMMSTVLTGKATDNHKKMFAACEEALHACEAKLTPGTTMGEVYAAHAEVFDKAGLGQHRLNACGYSMGAHYAPCWMDPPMFYENNSQVLAPNMVFFLHMICMDSDSGAAMTLGRSTLVTANQPKILSNQPLELTVK